MSEGVFWRKYFFGKYFWQQYFVQKKIQENIFLKNIFGANIFYENIFGANIFYENIFGTNIFYENIFCADIFGKNIFSSHLLLSTTYVQLPPPLIPYLKLRGGGQTKDERTQGPDGARNDCSCLGGFNFIAGRPNYV